MASNKTKKFWLSLGIGAGVILISAFITSQIALPLLLRSPKNIEVPNLVGNSTAAARRVLEEMGLHVVIQDSIWSSTEKLDTVLEQSPAAGDMVASEGTVYIRVSKGNQLVGVPSVIGLSLDTAVATLERAGLKGIKSSTRYSDSYAQNTVVSCSPEVDARVEKGTLVNLVVSRGPEPVIVQEPEIDTSLDLELEYEDVFNER